MSVEKPEEHLYDVEASFGMSLMKSGPVCTNVDFDLTQDEQDEAWEKIVEGELYIAWAKHSDECPCGAQADGTQDDEQPEKGDS